MSPILAPWMLLLEIAAIFHILPAHGVLSSATTWFSVFFCLLYEALLVSLGAVLSFM